ncbi:hypothetical protein LPB19_08750 [Marinobacter salinisoli]|uniref:Uncharacterized protein n=1 Tax=Marinobacter salinisoli TaxID=2769486 RepID=A0ABX7MMA1_9GAMM|nr:hypothetical protein [Marinobacter salinisoli]QSP93325.1 hypothetical protein LPB19_08750 [Marinobacter salinisoli]
MDEIGTEAKSIRQILQDKYGWNHMAFVDGMAPIDFQNGKQFWKPKTKLMRRIFGGSNGRSIRTDFVIGPGTYLKFVSPNASTESTLDYQNWLGYFERETQYSSPKEGSIFERWVLFKSWNRGGFEFTVAFPDSDVEVVIPSIVFFGAEWILVSD